MDHRWAAVYAHRERLMRIARARLDAHDAEDCVQEAMLRCVEFADLDEERLAQFLTSVTMRLCADVHRRRTRGDRLSRKLTGCWRDEPGPEDGVCDRAESEWLSAQLTGLTPKQRAIVEAKAEGLSLGAVAERLTVSYTAVESSLARVRRSLRVALESTWGLVALRPRRAAAGTAVATGAIVVAAVLQPYHAPVAPPREAIAVPAQGDRGDRVTTARTGSRRDSAPATVRVAVAPERRTPPAAGAELAPPDDSLGGASLPGGGGVEIKPPRETWVEHVERCLRNGPRVGLILGCHDDPEGTS